MIRPVIFILLCTLIACGQQYSRIPQLSSPNGEIILELVAEHDQLLYKISAGGKNVVSPSRIRLDIDRPDLQELQVSEVITGRGDTLIRPVLASKRSVIHSRYNSLLIRFRQPLALEFRLFDDGLAYRWIGQIPGSINVAREIFEIIPADTSRLYYAPIKSPEPFTYKKFRDNLREIFHPRDYYESDFESHYEDAPLEKVPEGKLLLSPALLSTSGYYINMAEADIQDYPGQFLVRKGKSLRSSFPRYPLSEHVPSNSVVYLDIKHTGKLSPYIAKTSGKRNFPWRILVISKKAVDIVSSDMVRRLMPAPVISGDLSWIRPGKITDEWAVDINLFGVGFKAGKNTASYKYYIDFATQYGLQYIMVDEGWYLDNNIERRNPEISLDSISAYAKKNGVGLGLWVNAQVLDRNLEKNMQMFSRMGVSLLMVDFVNRTDQKARNFYEKVAMSAAKHRLMINFHGVAPPAGIEMRFPNLITWESVMGSEWNGWSEHVTPSHDLIIPFTRMVSGSVDYEPGILEQGNQYLFRPISAKPMSQGTRAHNLSIYITYDSPLQYFIGNPAQAHKEPEYMRFLGSIPTTWDETLVLDGKPGEYLVTARRKDSAWYIGAMNNWQARELKIDLGALGLSRYNMVGIEDGLNADRYAADYRIIEKQDITDKLLTVRLASGGGGVWKLY